MIKIFFILNRKVTPQKNRCVGCWLLALPRAQTTRLSRILGIWFTYYVPVLINFMTPSKHLSIAYQGINLRRLLRFFFLSKAPHGARSATILFQAFKSRGRREEMRVGKTARGWGRGWEVPSSLPLPHLLIFPPALSLRAELHYLNAI